MRLYLVRLLLPHIVFFGVLAAGWWMGELTNRRALIFMSIWLAATLGLPLLPGGILWMTAAIALTDIVLVLMVFKGDITIN